MADFDPYALLGLTRTANPAAIKAAYRKRVQTSHPDRGGDADGFIAVVRAFGLLSDPEARRLYDETGAVDDDAVRTFRRDVATVLADMFDAAIASAMGTGLTLTGVDFIAQMTLAVNTGLADAKNGLGRTAGEIDSLEALRRRIRRRDGETNLFGERLDAQIAARTEAHTGIRRRVLLLETALVELGNYENEVDLIAALEAAE
jgi:curved DNA-binding protein CbpA